VRFVALPRGEPDESRAVGDAIQAPVRRRRLDVLGTCADNPRVAISAGPRGAFREEVLVEAPAVGRPRPSAVRRQEAWLAWSLLSPTLLVILFLVAYPFFSAIYLSLQDKMVGAPGRFVGVDNYLALLRDEIFLRTAWNSVLYTAVAVGLKFVLGLTMALILDQPRRFNNVFRTLLFVPWAVPVVIVALNWRWIFDDLSGFLNNFLITFHITSDIISWLADPRLAMACVIAVVVWSGTPFYSMTFLAGLQAIPKELYEAAEIDGASTLQQFFFVTIPRLKTIFLTTVMLSTIWTATNLQFVLILTKGGPASRTEIFPHLAYTTALGARRLGMGAAISLVFFPVLVVLIVLLTRRMLRPSDE
jgi:multiple sugar transport system permease protein